MKRMHYLIIAIVALSMNFSCTAQANKNEREETSVKAENVEVFYFHYTRRCVTCTNVENLSRDIVSELYGDDVIFDAFNLETEEGKEKGEKLGISGQTLVIVKGDTKIDITTEGFMNTRNPEKLKQIIKGKIDPLL